MERKTDVIRVLKYVLLAILAVLLVTITIANRQMVTLSLLPTEIAEFAGVNFSYTMPLFLVVMLGLAGGLLIGFIWEWMRETKHRSEAGKQAREARRLAREVEVLKADKRRADGQDDVLALLEDKPAA